MGFFDKLFGGKAASETKFSGQKYDDTHTVVRIATSWATRMEEVEQLLELM